MEIRGGDPELAAIAVHRPTTWDLEPSISSWRHALPPTAIQCAHLQGQRETVPGIFEVDLGYVGKSCDAVAQAVGVQHQAFGPRRGRSEGIQVDAEGLYELGSVSRVMVDESLEVGPELRIRSRDRSLGRNMSSTSPAGLHRAERCRSVDESVAGRHELVPVRRGTGSGHEGR
jgi:hypothetical protein